MIAASVWSIVCVACRRDAERTAERADHADADGVAEAERVADRHDPVARLHLRRVAELHFRERRASASRSAGSARCRSAGRGRRPSPRSVVGRRPRRRADTWILVGAFDDVVVGEDEAGLVDDEAGAGAFGALRRCGALRRGCGRAGAGAWRLAAAEEAASRSSLPRRRRRSRSGPGRAARDSVRMLTTAGVCALAMLRNVVRVDRAAERRAVASAATPTVCADEAGVRSSREAMTMPTASEATAMRTA